MRWGTVGGRVEHAWVFDGTPLESPKPNLVWRFNGASTTRSEPERVPRFHHYGETYRSLCHRRLETSDAVRSCLHQGPGGVEYTEEAPAERCAACAKEEAETASFIEVAWYARVGRNAFEKLVNDVRFVSQDEQPEDLGPTLRVAGEP